MAYLREASESYFKITKGYALKWLINVFSNNQILKCQRNVCYHKILKEYGKAFGIFRSAYLIENTFLIKRKKKYKKVNV